ncbi:MAG: substrate-binding domain-containing protein [Verrucomicrobia bacterium]|nr:substrate-binding domain-containing protein [Verrucomicrobiota bacterium]
MSDRVAIVMSEVFLRRLSPSLMPFVRRRQDFSILSIHRPIDTLCERLRAMEPSGLITEWLPEVTEQLLELGIPTVVADTDLSYPGVVSLDVDDWAVGREAANACGQAGYKSYACLGNSTPYSEQRIEGFQNALVREVPVFNEVGFSDARYSEQFIEPGKALLEWLSALPKPVGVFAAHDPLGRFLCSACLKLDLAVPEQVAVIGANNDELVCGLSYPMLSSVPIPWERLGDLVGEWMQRLRSGETPPSEPILVSPGPVVLRHSASHLVVDDPVLRRAMAYFSEHLGEPVNVASLCTDLRLARRTVERRFHEYYRCTPREMLCRMRINRAKELLLGSNQSVAQVAELCGFNDAERLAVVFRQVSGQSPTQWRKASTTGQKYDAQTYQKQA